MHYPRFFIANMLLLVLTSSAVAQSADTSFHSELSTVFITAYKEKPLFRSSLSVESLQIDSLSRMGNFNLTDLMAKTPGVSMLSTGVAISKPVIRGLYGNRVLVMVSGLKFDNQQWQEEHGLGMSDIGIGRIELIKGPMSVLYGTEAVGGVINVIEEAKPSFIGRSSDFAVRFNSNTLGGLIQAGVRVNEGNRWWRLRVGTENNSDYSDGKGTRVLNSRNDAYYLKGSYGFIRGNWTSNNHYMSSFSRFGFIFNDVYSFVLPDERYSRRLNVNPAHLVLLNLLSSENKFMLNKGSKLTINAGVQSNERMENEGGGAISLNMHLLTLQYLAKWERSINEKNRLIISNLGSFERNTNFGARKIVPDASMLEANASVFVETSIRKTALLENGLSAGVKRIHTFETPSVNSAEKEIRPFMKNAVYYNAFSGITFFPDEEFNIKFNASTGVRIPNLAELSSNGLHEGVFTYEVGDPTLKNEQSLGLNAQATFGLGSVEWEVSPFYNAFRNFVYLAPTNESWYGFPVYRYLQQDAYQYGGETKLSLKLNASFTFSTAYSGMIGKTADGNALPFTPPQKITPAVSFHRALKNSSTVHAYVNMDVLCAQLQVAPQEIATPAYQLLNAGMSMEGRAAGRNWMMSLACNNLLNQAYYDHMSRFKYFGLLNMGRNLTLQVRITLNKEKQTD